VKPQVSQHFDASFQVMESQMTEPGLQAGSPPSMPLTCGAIVTAFYGSVPGADGNE